MLFSTKTLLVLSPLLVMADLSCRPDGPVVPRPTNLGQRLPVLEATDKLTSILDQAVAGEIKAGWAVENTSFSLALVSMDQVDPGVPIWEYHHLAEGNVNGTEKVDRNSQYLIGSVSKAFADLALLKSGLDLDDPITKFFPEITNSTNIQWKDISLRSLGDHLAGIPSNC